MYVTADFFRDCRKDYICTYENDLKIAICVSIAPNVHSIRKLYCSVSGARTTGFCKQAIYHRVLQTHTHHRVLQNVQNHRVLQSVGPRTTGFYLQFSLK